MEADNQNLPPQEKYRQPGALDHDRMKTWWSGHHILAYVLFGLLGIAVVLGLYSHKLSQFSMNYVAPVHKQSEWKTYTTPYFTFNYPTDYEITREKIYLEPTIVNGKDMFGFVGIDLQSGEHIISITRNINDKPSKYWFDLIEKDFQEYQIANKDEAIGNDSIKRTKVDGEEAIEVYLPAVGQSRLASLSIDVPMNKYRITIKYIASKNSKEELDRFYKFLSTFKFVQPNSYASCIAAGNPMMKSKPPKCSTPEGLVFVEPVGACIQVIQPAKNPNTGETREFPTPCDVPEGWEKVNS